MTAAPVPLMIAARRVVDLEILVSTWCLAFHENERTLNSFPPTTFGAISKREAREAKSTVRVRRVRRVRRVSSIRSSRSIRKIRSICRIRSVCALVHEVVKLIKSSKQHHRGTAAILYQ